MKKLFLSIALAVLLLGALRGQHDCSSIADFSAGRQWTYQWYGSNQKPSFQTFHRVLPERGAPERTRLEVVVLNAFQDTLYRGEYGVRCGTEGLTVDLLAKLTPEMLGSLAGFELRTEENGWLLPHGLHSGDSIPQAYSHVAGYSGGAKVMDIDLAIGPVYILEQEDLTTPAGGFPCVAMAYELWVTQAVRKRFRLRDWFAPAVGVIRREVFDRRGRFYGYCELVEVK